MEGKGVCLDTFVLIRKTNKTYKLFSGHSNARVDGEQEKDLHSEVHKIDQKVFVAVTKARYSTPFSRTFSDAASKISGSS